MRQILKSAVIAAAVAVLFTLGSAFAQGREGETVIICHIPPGNPEAAHTIEIPVSALPAHLAHGDTLGPCPTPYP
jgi:hypothetical protein